MSDRIPLDDLTSDQLDAVYAERDRLHRSRGRWAAHAGRLIDRALTAEARATELETEVARLTAGQCLDRLSMCQQHHTPPVAGCPYPQCVAARQQQETDHA